MMKTGDVCDVRYQLFRNEMLQKENALRIRWFLRNQQRLIDNLREPTFVKQTTRVIAESKKREREKCIEKSIVHQKPLSHLRLLKSDGSINIIDIMKPIDPNVRAIFYEKGIPSFTAANNYLIERYKKSPEKRFYFPECTNWIYGWRLGDYAPILRSKIGLKSVMLAEFYQRKTFNLYRDSEWYRGCQTKDARNFNC